MTTIFTNLTNRWKKQWINRDLTPRLGELASEFATRLLASLVIIGAVGAAIIYLLPYYLLPYQGIIAVGGVEFLALVYVLILGIATAHSFDENRVKFILEQIQLDLTHIGGLAGYSHLDDLKLSIDELTVRIGQS
jgi:VIT1/CCC1 family predicted Fe2+/Mn2+ transporter